MLNTSTGDYPTVGRREDARPGVAPPTLQSALDRVTRESEEKTLLLSELRHRMKNNLQTVQSLLRLQKSRTPNPSARKELSHLEMQIAALNGVDGELLVADEKRFVDLGMYLRRLMGKLKDAFGINAGPILFRVELDAVEIPCRTAANIGLLINEAVTNSFKHAVPNGATEICVTLKRTNGVAILTVSDDGPGFPPDLMARLGDPYLTSRARPLHGRDGETAGLGLGIFISKTLLERTGAEITFHNATPEGHATVTVAWPRQTVETGGLLL